MHLEKSKTTNNLGWSSLLQAIASQSGQDLCIFVSSVISPYIVQINANFFACIQLPRLHKSGFISQTLFSHRSTRNYVIK